MAVTVQRPHERRWSRWRSEVVTSRGVRARARPMSALGVGLFAAVVASWGAVASFVGPDFGYRPTTYHAWVWVAQNWLLHLLPGAGGLVAGLLITRLSPRRLGSGGPLGMSALLLIAAGAWFVLGPTLWPTFEASPAFAVGVSNWMSFVNQAGSSLGPGLLLAVFGGMALKAAVTRPKVAVAEPEPEVTLRDGEDRLSPAEAGPA